MLPRLRLGLADTLFDLAKQVSYGFSKRMKRKLTRFPRLSCAFRDKSLAGDYDLTWPGIAALLAARDGHMQHNRKHFLGS